MKYGAAVSVKTAQCTSGGGCGWRVSRKARKARKEDQVVVSKNSNSFANFAPLRECDVDFDVIR
jgi:hypothetical protein